MIRLAHLFQTASAASQEVDGTAVKTFTACLMLLIPLLVAIVFLNLTNRTVICLVYTMIGLTLLALAMVRLGFFRIAVPVMALGLGLLGTAAVFSLGRSSPHAVYMLCTFHLLILFTTALISYNRCYLYLYSTIAIASFALHYGLGEGPLPSGTDDFILCVGLILISSLVIRNTLAARKQLFLQLKKSSRENAEKADQLAGLYQDLLRAMDEREELAEKYRLLLETATDAILIAQDGVIKFSNRQTQEMFGYSPGELHAIPFSRIVHSDDRDMVARRHKERLSGGTPPSAYTFRAIDKQGNTLWLQIHTVTTLWEKKPATLNFIQDITHHKQMEQQIQQSQKMEAIGTLAGGIAHDFNNLLSGMFAYLQLAENHSDSPEKVRRDISQVRLGAEKAADLCRQILLISRKSEPKKETIFLAGIVQEVLDLMQATLPASIEIRQDLESGACIHANPGKIHQVILNLCTNAFQAMADSPRGVLDVSLTETRVYQDPSLNGKGIPPGEYLCLTVRDTGHGMDLETQKKLFDPYFTTKAPGKGTGLGLAVALSIIEDHRGYVRVFSEKEKGSEFQVFFPKESARISNPVRTEAAAAPLSHRGCLLFIEDEDNLRQAISFLLEEQGYEVISCGDSPEAWDLFESDPDRFDLVISDEVLPGMPGSALIRQIKTLAPHTPAVLCSGSTTMIPSEKLSQVEAFIPKPLETSLLLKTIHALIHGVPSGLPQGTDRPRRAGNPGPSLPGFPAGISPK